MMLTRMAKKGGCAAKVAASELREILSRVKFPPKKDSVLVDGSLFDDAAIIKVNSELALVQTLDFFTPVVDTPYSFGAVAAANALSDVYAMGGIPQTTLAILAFPLATMNNEIVAEVLQGACDILAKAKTSLVGGHSIDDDTLKFGLSVTGHVHPDKVWSNAGAKPGDVLILTKPLGTGSTCAALKERAISESEMKEVVESMTALNRVPEILAAEDAACVHAATDITGFGLMGHALQMAQASDVKFRFDIKKVPRFSQVMEFLEKDFLTKAHFTNQKYVEGKISWGSLTEIEKLLTLDPQTSGGLLLSVPSDKAPGILAAIKKYFPMAESIGHVESYQTESRILFL